MESTQPNRESYVQRKKEILDMSLKLFNILKEEFKLDNSLEMRELFDYTNQLYFYHLGYKK